MPEAWAGKLRGHMYREQVSVRELAEEAGLSYTYVIDIMRGRRIAPRARERLEAAFQRITERRAQEKRKRVHGSDGHASAEQPDLANPHYSVQGDYNT